MFSDKHHLTCGVHADSGDTDVDAALLPPRAVDVILTLMYGLGTPHYRRVGHDGTLAGLFSWRHETCNVLDIACGRLNICGRAI